VDPDMTASRFGPGMIKDGNGGCGGTASTAHVHHEVSDIGLPDVEQVQPGLAPVQ
jgi:hypothetical protein